MTWETKSVENTATSGISTIRCMPQLSLFDPINEQNILKITNLPSLTLFSCFQDKVRKQLDISKIV